MKTIHQTYNIHAPREKVWQVLTDPKIINEWGGGHDYYLDPLKKLLEKPKNEKNN